MSLAGKRSSQGDEYQLRVAMHWLIRLLMEDDIKGIQVESLGLPGESDRVTVDDVVIIYKNGHTAFIQAKKNQPQHHFWSFSDKVLQDELRKARDQLEAKENSVAWFYSRSPFGEVEALVENCRSYPGFENFDGKADGNQSVRLKQLASILDRPEREAFTFAQKLRFGPPYSFEDWDHDNLNILDRLVPHADIALGVLERYLESHQTNLRDSKYIVTRPDILAELDSRGLSPTPKRRESEILDAFADASQIGRGWLRTVDGESIPRKELTCLIELIEQGSRSVLLTDRPGTGKTCLLLDLADYIERSTHWGLLFIKGDQFTDASNENDLAGKGMPTDIVGQCARLAEFRRVVVIIDSLDVLSLSRQHGSLKVFLGLMDRLERVEGVTLILACRDFDLQYDPLLRGRTWQHRINLEPLDFTSIVEPFLSKWGVAASCLSTELRELLQLPQNLRLFEKLAGLGTASDIISAHQLYNRFLEDLVVKDPQLGDTALAALHAMANYLIQQRTLKYPKPAFEAGEAVIQRLISQEVLFEPSPGILEFTHQTLADSLVVRSALSRNETLHAFILAHPPLPFVRPAVRAFFFFLRANQPDAFRKQVWAALSDDRIAYHLKRLLTESLAEVAPEDEDWPLLRRLFLYQPDLFRRLLWRAQSEAWFYMLTRHWLPAAKVARSRENWLIQFVDRLRIWMNSKAKDVVALWREAIASNWAERKNLAGTIAFALGKFKSWHTEGVRELLTALEENITGDRNRLGASLSRWVQETNGGDELLWSHIVKNVTSEDLSGWKIGEKLHCGPHEFHHEQFLADRLKESDQLLSLALRSVEDWSDASAGLYRRNALRSEFLHHTSWEYRHSGHDMYHADDSVVLLNSLEGALKHRARQNDEWWGTSEPLLRTSREESIRYLIIQAYKENIDDNIQGIESQLKDRELFRYGRLEYELGELMRSAYPFISEPCQLANQAMISSLFEHEKSNDEDSKWISRRIYDLLVWIPSLFRTPETQAHIDNWRHRFGYDRPSPRIHSWGGTVGSPVSTQTVLEFSDDALFRLLHHYNDYTGWSERLEEGGLTGGRDQVRMVLRNASSLNPSRFLGLFTRFIDEDLHHDYIHAFVDGIAEHLRYTFGNLQKPAGWEPVEPAPDRSDLGMAILNLLERYPIISEQSWTVSHALEACCHVLDDTESAERLIFLLFSLLRADDPDEDRSTVERPTDLASVAINSTRGVAAESAMILCNNLVEKDLQLPELLPPLLRHFARDHSVAVRVSILRRLPYLMHKRPELGWRLFADVFREPQTHLWAHAERCFYYEYRDRFDQVQPYMDRLLHEGMEEAGGTWGRICTLASLADHISQEHLFSTLVPTHVSAWKGVAQVFCTNMDRPEHTEACHRGLMLILQQKGLSLEIFRTIEQCFGQKNNQGIIRHEFALEFLKSIAENKAEFEFHHFLDWLGNEARHDPRSTLQIAEILADGIEARENPHRLWHTEPLVAALVEIMREADETDDSQLAERAIKLQDRFLRLDLQGMEDLLDRAGRS